MMKKSDHPSLIDDPGSSSKRALARDRERPLVEERDLAHDDSDLEVRGRRYRIGVQDGFVGIWELRSGEQVGTFMEDAFSAAWARYLELEQSRSLNGFMLRTREFLGHRWYAIVVVVLGALTVAYLRTEDPSLSPTGARVRVHEAPRAVRPIADLGSSLAGTLDPSLAAPPLAGRSTGEGHGREQQKKDRGAGKDGPAGGGATAASSPSGGTTGSGTSGGTSGGSSSGDPGGSTGSDGGSGGGGSESEPPPEPEDPPTSAQPPPPDS
jgi:hypothetical protein